MGDWMGFNQKWDFRRKENTSDDSLSDNLESNSSDEPVLKKHKLASQLDKGTTTTTTTTSKATRQHAGKAWKSSSKKTGAKPAKSKKTGRSKNTSAHAEEDNNIKKRKRVTRKREPDDELMNDIGVFMGKLLDELKVSRESLFGWMSAEICKPDGDNKSASLKKETKTGKEENKKAQPRRSRRTTKNKKVPEGKKEKKAQMKGKNQIGEQTEPEEKIAEKNIVEDETQNVCRQGQERRNVGFDCTAGPWESFLRCGEAGDARNYFQQQENQERGNHGQFVKLMTSNDEDKVKSLGSTSMEKQKCLVLGIRAQKNSFEMPERYSKGKKTTAETIMGQARDVARVESMVISAETQKDRNFETPIEPKLSSLCSSFPSNPGIASFASNNFQLRPPSQIQYSPEIQAEPSYVHQGLRNLNCLYPNNAYFPGLLSSVFNFQTQVSSDNLRRDNSGNMLGGLRMSGGAIRFSGGALPEHFTGVDVNNLSDYRTNPVRQMHFQT